MTTVAVDTNILFIAVQCFSTCDENIFFCFSLIYFHFCFGVSLYTQNSSGMVIRFLQPLQSPAPQCPKLKFGAICNKAFETNMSNQYSSLTQVRKLPDNSSLFSAPVKVINFECCLIESGGLLLGGLEGARDQACQIPGF